MVVPRDVATQDAVSIAIPSSSSARTARDDVESRVLLAPEVSQSQRCPWTRAITKLQPRYAFEGFRGADVYLGRLWEL